ncbi:cellulose binding domain-containing protein [Streptomyces sp. enrichment culture]|uniref:cellulose binding domain-containing protein n=1 Tax=Streptomyces sp. enrichment culture TaxID=1795815 RepID=UPI003F57405E
MHRGVPARLLLVGRLPGGGHRREHRTGPLTGWSVAWDLGGSAVTNLWNGSLSVTQDRATVRSTAHNGALSPGATTSFGFTANGSAGAPVPECAGA